MEIIEENISSSSTSESSEEEVNINLIPTKVEEASESDVLVEVKHGESSVSEKDYQTLSHILSDSEIEEDQSMSLDESENTDGNEESFRERCLKELRSDELLLNIINKLEKSNRLNDFMKLMRHLSTGEIAMDNIVWILMLERAKFQSCKNTVAMRYSKVTKLFWSIVYRLCKSSGLKIFAGEKNWGQVVSNECGRSRYTPEKSKINFAVPSESVLRYINRRLPKVIPPGKIHQSLDLLSDQKDVVLMADGKLVTKGLKENFCGDVNLFGHEIDPNINELENEIQRHLEYLSNCTCNFRIAAPSDKYHMLSDLVNVMTVVIGKIRKFGANEMKRLKTYEKSVFCDQKYMKVISMCKTNIYTSKIWLKKVLKVNVEIHDIMAQLQNNKHLFSIASNPNVSDKSNVRLLHAAETVSGHIDPLDYPHLIKAGSDIHKDLVRQSLMTTGTIFTAVGLNNVSSMKSHFKRFVLDIGFNEDCISANHVGLATLTDIIMPSMLPSCAVLYEEGCRYLNGKNRNKVICSPSHWIIRHHHTTAEKKWECNHLIDMDYDNIVVMFLDGDINASIGLSNCDILNAVATMRIVKCMKLSAVQYYGNSVMVTECTHDSETWRSIWKVIQRYYDQKIPTQPKKTSDIKKDIIPILEKFAKTNTKAILEVPLMRDVIGEYGMVGKFSAYNIPQTPMRSGNTDIPYMTFQEICYELSDLIEEGYNFLRVEASEILAFVVTNSDRIIQPGIPPHLPIAYGMRGHSLPMKIMRNMVNDIRNELQKHNTSVLCEVYDGQFHQLIVRSENSEPLTRLQMMHDHFNTVMKKYDKKELLGKILPYSEITEDDRKQIEMNTFVEETVLQLDSVTLTIMKEDNCNRFMIETNAIGGFSMKDFVTYWRHKLNRGTSEQLVTNVNDQDRTVFLTAAEMKQLIVGTKFHRRLPSTRYIADPNSESESDNSDYNSNYADKDSESEDTDIDVNVVEESTLTNVSVVSTGQSCIKKVLAGLKKLKNKHNWKEHNVNSFLENYLKSKNGIEKLFLYEMDVINEEVMSCFGKQLFQKKDVKSVRIDKCALQLKKFHNCLNILVVKKKEMK